MMGAPSPDFAPLPPHSIEAEQALLGALLADNSALVRIADVIVEEDFYRSDHRILFAAIAELIDSGTPADLITVANKLQGVGKLQVIGGMAYLGALAAGMPSTANIRRYAEIVRDRSLERRLQAFGEQCKDPISGRPIADVLIERERGLEQLIHATRLNGRRVWSESIDLERLAMQEPQNPNSSSTIGYPAAT